VVGRIFLSNVVDVGVDVLSFGGIVTGHVDAQDMGYVVYGLVSNVSREFDWSFMIDWVSSDCFPD